MSISIAGSRSPSGSRAAGIGQGAAGASVHLLPGRVVLYAWLLAGVPIAVLQLAHTGLHERNELPPLLHWLRDTGLAVPGAALAVVVAAWLVARRWGNPARPVTSVTALAWGGLAAVLFAAASLPGIHLHAILFGTEAEAGVGNLDHLVAEGTSALQTAVLVVIPVALLAGVPWRAARTADEVIHAPGPGLALDGADR